MGQQLENSAEKGSSRARKLALRLGISLLFIVLIYSKTDLGSLLQTLRSVSWQTALLLPILYAVGQIISSFKWRIFLNQIGLQRSIPETLRAYFFGMFVNTFAFGTVGGDVARCLVLRPPKGKRAAAVATAVADRVHGLGVLLSIGAVAILILQPASLGSLALPFSVLCISGLALGWLLGPKLLTKIFPETHKHGQSAREVKNAFPKKASPFLAATVISVTFHSLQIYMHLIIARELGLGGALSIGLLFATVPLVNVASAMPVSINGLGVREAMYLLLFVPLGVPKESAVAFGAIWIVTVTVVSALGGLLLAPSAEAREASKEAALETRPAEEPKKMAAN